MRIYLVLIAGFVGACGCLEDDVKKINGEYNLKNIQQSEVKYTSIARPFDEYVTSEGVETIYAVAGTEDVEIIVNRKLEKVTIKYKYQNRSVVEVWRIDGMEIESEAPDECFGGT